MARVDIVFSRLMLIDLLQIEMEWRDRVSLLRRGGSRSIREGGVNHQNRRREN